MIDGVTVGHWTDSAGLTGCTVVLLPDGATGGVHIAGGAAGTRQTDSLQVGHVVSEVQAFCLCGGSAFGLRAADGVMDWLAERGRGIVYGGRRIPIVPAAVLFDLGIGSESAFPTASAGHAACEAATTEPAEGCVGAGTGATVNKWRGREHARKAGIGIASADDGPLEVTAIVANNAAGDVSEFVDGAPAPMDGTATVLVVVVTNATLTKPQAGHVGRMATAGIAATVRPAFTMSDGDVIFVAATGRLETETSRVGALAAVAVESAIRRSILTAWTLGGVPGSAVAPTG